MHLIAPQALLSKCNKHQLITVMLSHKFWLPHTYIKLDTIYNNFHFTFQQQQILYADLKAHI